MEKENTTNGTAPGTSQMKQEKAATKAKKLAKMQMYAVLGLELSKTILEKLEQVEESIAILAAQKARELNPEQPKANPGTKAN